MPLKSRQRSSKLNHLAHNFQLIKDFHDDQPSYLPSVTAKTINDSLQRRPSQPSIFRNHLDEATSTPTNVPSIVRFQNESNLSAKIGLPSTLRKPRWTDGKYSPRDNSSQYYLGRKSVFPLR